MKLWIVGKMNDGGAWEFCGVFDSRAKAESRCTLISNFVAPAELNEALPEELREWPGCYYPKAILAAADER